MGQGEKSGITWNFSHWLTSASVLMGQGEKSGITWNFAFPLTILKMPPRPRVSDGQASARISRMQVTKFFGPVLPLQWILRTGPGSPDEMNKLPRTEFLVSSFGNFMVEKESSSSWVLAIRVS